MPYRRSQVYFGCFALEGVTMAPALHSLRPHSRLASSSSDAGSCKAPHKTWSQWFHFWFSKQETTSLSVGQAVTHCCWISVATVRQGPEDTAWSVEAWKATFHDPFPLEFILVPSFPCQRVGRHHYLHTCLCWWIRLWIPFDLLQDLEEIDPLGRVVVSSSSLPGQPSSLENFHAKKHIHLSHAHLYETSGINTTIS